MQSLLPFLLVNDHSVLILRDPKKDIVPLLTQIIKRSSIQRKGGMFSTQG
jgi:hypothetical protein